MDGWMDKGVHNIPIAKVWGLNMQIIKGILH